MTDQEFKRMSRADLIEVIYQYQCREQEQSEQIAELRAQLDDKKTRIEQAGSIAEAALSLNHIFESAQAAADQYMAEIREANADKEAQAQQILAEARRKADLIELQAEREARAMREKAERDCSAMYFKIKEVLRNYDELRGLLAGQIS